MKASGNGRFCYINFQEEVNYVEQTVGTLAVRVDKLERDTTELFDKTNAANISLAAVNEKLSSMLTTLGELKAGLANLQAAPSRKWDTVFKAAITGIVSLAAGYFLAKFK
jgi:hypothetical protein